MSPLAKSHKGPPVLAAIFSGPHHAHDDGEEESGEGGDNYEAKSDAMQAFIDAVKGDDVKTACEAYDTLHKLHADDEDEEDGEEEDEDEGG